jgi:hypothetical protein
MIETVADAAPTAIDRPVVRWRPATRVAFRFSFLYFGLYVITTQMLNGLLVIPNFGFPPLETRPPLRNVIEWTALHVFGITQPLVITGSGSGDKTANWVAAFFLLVISALLTVVWSAVDRKRTAYPALTSTRHHVPPVGQYFGALRSRESRSWELDASQLLCFAAAAFRDAARSFMRVASTPLADAASLSSCAASEST